MRALAEIPRSRVVFIRRRLDVRTGCRVYISRSAPAIWTMSIDLPSLEDVADVPFHALAESTDPLPLPRRSSWCAHTASAIPVAGGVAFRSTTPCETMKHSTSGSARTSAAIASPPTPSCCRGGLYYGPVEPRDAGVLAESVLRNEILIDAYRGRSSMARTAQAAETFVRRAPPASPPATPCASSPARHSPTAASTFTSATMPAHCTKSRSSPTSPPRRPISPAPPNRPARSCSSGWWITKRVGSRATH